MDLNGSKLSQEAVSAIENGRLIEAIKITRVKAGLGLKESKEKVEAYIEAHPELKARMQANKVSFNMSQERFLHIFIVVALVVAYLVFFRA